MLLFIIGVVSGFIGGMGIGGGTILIPSMIFLVRTPQQIAQGINLASFIPTSLAAVFVHSKRRHVRFKIAFLLILSGIPGAILGSILASHVSAQLLRKLFGWFLLIMGIYEMLRKEKIK
ncbi:MAG: sulfite exporter TauE/SafE family protein [Caldicoprobacterales bacterium]|jgi:uncharacterized membrane protein YfcA|nr:sulfite exporter TauE/SafE family protein [Clostridiales bacterium]